MKKKVKIAILSAIAICLCGAVGVQMLESASADVAYVADIFGTEKISIKNDYRIS